MKILLTGSGGFIGSFLCEELFKRGYKLKIILRYTSTANLANLNFLEKEILEKIEIIFGDLQDPEVVSEAVKDVDYVINLASLISIPYSFVFPRSTVFNNISIIINLMENLKNKKIPLIHISTSEVYGKINYLPIDENHPKSAKSPYAASKIFMDEFVKSYGEYYKIPFKIVRPFNTFGPRQSQRALIPSIMLQVLKGKAVRIGNLYPKRDFTYVLDIVNGIINILESDKGFGEEIILCSGKSYSVTEVIEKIKEISKEDFKIIRDEKRERPKEVEIDNLTGTFEKAKKLFGFYPKISFEEGLKLTWEWFKENKDKYFSFIRVE
ncbi:MAG: GDP-mannose 4,6-dehydratase [candidate division WOR-3 bacterium]|uniref:NAD-dependent epimerase/dehydratase family protein n=1 Tax=candidate division WOR-3 bacterium TaxID=2052148 RepID=A0A7V3ZTA5_UNCW3